MKILVLPDIHGRRFWENAVENIDSCDKVLFLGDYLDPYDFEDILVRKAIDNFRKIIDFAKSLPSKVVMLLGNHDMPYYSDDYRALSHYHCRWSGEWHYVIKGIFEENNQLFKIAHVEDNVLFTHAGCNKQWLKSLETVPNSLCDLETMLNNLVNSKEGLRLLYMVSSYRGGDDDAGSCIWAHVDEIANDYDGLSFADCKDVKQVFGHTLQVEYDEDWNIVSGGSIETPNAKMLDTRCAYLLDTATFIAEPVPLL